MRHVPNWRGVDHPWRRIKRTLPAMMQPQATPESRAYQTYLAMCKRVDVTPADLASWQKANGQAPNNLFPMNWGHALSR